MSNMIVDNVEHDDNYDSASLNTLTLTTQVGEDTGTVGFTSFCFKELNPESILETTV